MSKKETGKGANFDTRPNPFGAANKQAQARPAFGDCGDVGLVLDKVISAGCGVILASTRDGGALVLTILDGDTRHRTYCSTPTELEEALARLDMYYTQ